LGSSGAFDTIDWIPIDQLAKIVVELSRIRINNGAEEIYHVVHPTPLTWKTIMPHIRSALEAAAILRRSDELSEIHIIPYLDWFRLLQKSASNANERNMVTAEDVHANPAIKLLDFMKFCWRAIS
jgi:hypothetical protein